jgi:NAD(P)H-dependent FMN reductase
LALTRSVELKLQELGASTYLWDLGARPLPNADPRYHHDPDQHPSPEVRELVDRAHQADGILLSSPVYHNSYSGILKDAIDSLAIPQFQYKAVGLLSHGGDRSTQAVDHLRIVTRGLLGVATPTQVCTRREDFTQSEASLVLGNADIIARVERFCVEFMQFSATMRVLRTLPR